MQLCCNEGSVGVKRTFQIHADILRIFFIYSIRCPEKITFPSRKIQKLTVTKA